MQRKPLTRQRSPWVNQHHPFNVLGYVAQLWTRAVHDGTLRVLMGEEAEGWHLSISHTRRYPTWDEIAHARYELLPADRDFVMHLPPPDQYVALHDTTFHLHEHPPRQVALPS